MNIKTLIRENYPDIEIVELLGKGTSASSYLCKYNKKDVTLRIEEKPNKSSILKYKILKKLNCKYIQKIYDYRIVSEGKYLFTLSQYAKGGTLLDLPDMLENKTEKEKRKIKYKIALGLLKGLKYLFDHNLFHRDIKPDNIVVDEKGNITYIDFGNLCSYDNIIGTECAFTAGSVLSKPAIKKTPIFPGKFYTQGVNTNRAYCNPEMAKLVDEGKEKELQNSYMKRVLYDNDIWGMIFCLAFIEKELDISFLRPVKPKVKKCEIEDSEDFENYALGFNYVWREYMENKNNLFYPVYKLYLENKSISKMISKMEEKIESCKEFEKSPKINPETGRSISVNGPTYKKLEKQCGSPKKPTHIDCSGKCKSPLKSGTRKGKECGANAKYWVKNKCVCGRHAK